MRRVRFLSGLLLLIVGLTVLSPHFAWEVLAADAQHGAQVPHGVHHHGDALPLLDQHGEHACGGHMFSHMPVQASSSDQPPLLRSGQFTVPAGPPAGFASRDPESPERPPRVRPA